MNFRPPSEMRFASDKGFVRMIKSSFEVTKSVSTVHSVCGLWVDVDRWSDSDKVGFPEIGPLRGDFGMWSVLKNLVVT